MPLGIWRTMLSFGAHFRFWQVTVSEFSMATIVSLKATGH